MDKHIVYFTQCVCLLTLLAPEVSSAINRHYFLAAVEVDWDYAPSGMNMVDNEYRTFNEKLIPGKARMGRIYRKAIYRQFTDDSFTVQVVQPSWNGINGPLISGEVGDVMFIHFKNMASRNFSIHVHGFRYDKQSEGAPYHDGLLDEIDDRVPPGGMYVYRWEMPKSFQPTADDDNCVVWPYHGSFSLSGIRAGIVGFGLTCKPGILLANGRRGDVDRELWVYADRTDETLNPYIDINTYRCGSPKMCKLLHAIRDRQFQTSSTISHFNGFAYGNVPDFEVCSGERVVVYLMTLAYSVLTFHINGQTMIRMRQRKETIEVGPGMSESAYMIPAYPGRWLMLSKHQTDFEGGMSAFLNVMKCHQKIPLNKPQPQLKGTLRRYFLAIEEHLWNYFPTKKLLHDGNEGKFLNQRPNRIGSVYKKVSFRGYTDSSFLKKTTHLGLAGPPIKAAVGDMVEVTVLNTANRVYSFLANGVELTKENEGAVYKNHIKSMKVNGAVISPGAVRVYRFQVTENSGPTKYDPDCLTSTYHSSVNYIQDVHSGLFGPLLICKPGTLDKAGNQILYNREFFVNWMVIDENRSWYIDENIHLFTQAGKAYNELKRDTQFVTSNQMAAINGRSFGTLGDFTMCLGDRVTWHMYGFGDDEGLHEFTFDGNNFVLDGKMVDTANVFQGMGQTVTMVPDFGGHRLKLYTQNQDNKRNGMFAYYNVLACDQKHGIMTIPTGPLPTPKGLVKRYYIGAMAIEWDYCPTLTDQTRMQRLDHPESSDFDGVRNDGPFIGSRYTKSVFREFIDDSFSFFRKADQEDIHLGLLGPFVRAGVGDIIEIVLKNDLKFPVSFSPRNIVPADGAVGKQTQPGTTVLYRFYVPQRSAPEKHGPACVGYTYTSQAHVSKDIESGLFGPLVICRPGVLDPSTNRRSDGLRERALSFVTFHEWQSHFYAINKLRAPVPFPSELEEGNNDIGHGLGSFMQGHKDGIPMKSMTSISETDREKYRSSNMYATINGRIYGNLWGFVLRQGEPVAWYLSSQGGHQGIHTVHFHGNLILNMGKISTLRDVTEIYPGNYKTVVTVFKNPGTWLLHCHNLVHARNGMKIRYTVVPEVKGTVPIEPNT